jgi:hypothetical protein
MRKFSLFTVVVGLVMALFVPAASAATPYCGITWGSQPEAAPQMGPGPVVGARAGRHACFDRLVIDIANRTEPTGYTVQYVPQVVQDGSGDVIPLRGGAFLQVTVNAPDYDGGGDSASGWVSGQEIANVAGFTTFRQVKSAGGFEGYTSVGLGVRARLPFRVLRLDGPGNASRLVIDVAHRW